MPASPGNELNAVLPGPRCPTKPGEVTYDDDFPGSFVGLNGERERSPRQKQLSIRRTVSVRSGLSQVRQFPGPNRTGFPASPIWLQARLRNQIRMMWINVTGFDRNPGKRVLKPERALPEQKIEGLIGCGKSPLCCMKGTASQENLLGAKELFAREKIPQRLGQVRFRVSSIL
jgi:hypothetical protein